MNHKIYDNLLIQFDKLFAHNRQGSYRTKHRYAQAFRRFLVFLAEEYRMERIANIAPKHIHAYADKFTQSGKSTAYIKTELAAIRFWHDQIPGAKFRKLPSNEDLYLARRKYGGVDRTWSSGEFHAALTKAEAMNRQDYVAILCLGRYAGLRLHECFRLDTQAAEAALKTGRLVVKGKGGLVREVLINTSIKIPLQEMLSVTPRGQKLFVPKNDKTHLAMQRFQNFLTRYRPEIQDADSTRPLHFHGLRHSYAVEQYQRFLTEGLDELAAKRQVSKTLGHNRPEVTNCYLASLKGGDKDA